MDTGQHLQNEKFIFQVEKIGIDMNKLLEQIDTCVVKQVYK